LYGSVTYHQTPLPRGVFREGNFFNLLGFLRKKNPKTPPKFSLPYKNISKPLPQKISGYAPAPSLFEDEISFMNDHKFQIY